MNHLLVGTHGRSIYLAEIDKVQQLNSDILNKDLYLYNINNIKRSNNWGTKWGTCGNYFQPNMEIVVYSENSNKYSLSIISENGDIVHKSEGIFDKGLNYINYNLRYDSYTKENDDDNSYYLEKGSYKLIVSGNSSSSSNEFEIK